MSELPQEQLNIETQQAYDFLTLKRWREAEEGFLSVFDEKESSIASCLGFIYDQKNSDLHNIDKSIFYYNIAAENGDNYAQHALGGLLLDKGKIFEASEAYKKCGLAGNSDCSYMAFRTYKKLGKQKDAEDFLQIAANQGHPIATQIISVKYMLGHFGIRKSFFGLKSYFSNLPRLLRYVKENLR